MYTNDVIVPFETLKGKTLKEVHGLVKDGEEVRFITTDGKEYVMYHSQDCCESVSIDDVCGDVEDLIGSEILVAEENESEDWPYGVPKPEHVQSFTWTFYKLATRKGYVDIRWFGESNGYYSESIYLHEVIKEEEETTTAKLTSPSVDELNTFFEQAERENKCIFISIDNRGDLVNICCRIKFHHIRLLKDMIGHVLDVFDDRVEFGDGEMYALDDKGTIRYSSWENDNKVGFYSCDLMDIKEVRVIPDETFERIAILDEVIRAKSEVLIAERDAINEKLALVRVDNRIDFEI